MPQGRTYFTCNSYGSDIFPLPSALWVNQSTSVSLNWLLDSNTTVKLSSIQRSVNLCSWIFTRPDQAKQQVWIQQPGLNSMFTLVWAGGWIEWDPEVPFDLDDSVTTVFVRWYPKLTHSIKAKALASVEWRSHAICHVSEPCSLMSVFLVLLSSEGMKLLPQIQILLHSHSKIPLLMNCFFTSLSLFFLFG